MRYSIEKIYKLFGRFDKIVTISFHRVSPSFLEYSDSLTGTFYYSPKERSILEEQIQYMNDSSGFIKFKEVLNNVSDSKKETLIRDGINCEDIADIFYLPQFNQENKFQSKETRKLPAPNIIEIDFDDDFDYDSMLINLNERKFESGHKLTPEETAEHYGILLNIERKGIESIDQESNELNILIKKHYLRSRLRHKQANEKEINELKEIENKELMNKVMILRNEIKEAGIGKKSFEKIKPQIEQITPYLLEFNEKRLTHGKFPVWLNYERFLHIFLGHVNETNLGGTFDDKTKFQYLIDDIFRLIEIVLDSIEDDIQTHFVEYSGKNFKRHGEMAIYYNGDYFVIAINPNGLLMTFYKIG